MPTPALPQWGDHDPNEHPIWLYSKSAELGDPARWRDNYEITTDAALHRLETSDAWRAVLDDLRSMEERHRANHGEALILMQPQLVIKPYGSVCDKAYRRNVVRRDTEPSVDDLVGPHNWYTILGDILRTTIVVFTIDAVEPVCAAIVNALQNDEISAEWEPRSELRGYHAAHVRFEWKAKVVTTKQAALDGSIAVEVQVKTYLHHTLARLTHERYREKRVVPDALGDVEWAWSPDSREFHTNLLGHVVQYLDGAISNLRKRES